MVIHDFENALKFLLKLDVGPDLLVHSIKLWERTSGFLDYLRRNGYLWDSLAVDLLFYCKEMEIGALLHDIGKTHIPFDILNKPGPLTDLEIVSLKKHTLLSRDVLHYNYIEFSFTLSEDVIRNILLLHHEVLDASGYPMGLGAQEIPNYVRCITILDIFVALTEDRVYKKGLSVEEALSIINKDKGLKYDADILNLITCYIKQEVQ